MHAVLGRPSAMPITARHLANRAPIPAYSCNRARSPSGDHAGGDEPVDEPVAVPAALPDGLEQNCAADMIAETRRGDEQLPLGDRQQALAATHEDLRGRSVRGRTHGAAPQVQLRISGRSSPCLSI